MMWMTHGRTPSHSRPQFSVPWGWLCRSPARSPSQTAAWPSSRAHAHGRRPTDLPGACRWPRTPGPAARHPRGSGAGTRCSAPSPPAAPWPGGQGRHGRGPVLSGTPASPAHPKQLYLGLAWGDCGGPAGSSLRLSPSSPSTTVGSFPALCPPPTRIILGVWLSPRSRTFSWGHMFSAFQMPFL